MQIDDFMITSSWSSNRKMPQHLLEDFLAGALIHGLLDKGALAFRMEPIAPPDICALGLTEDFRLVEDRQRDAPSRSPSRSGARRFPASLPGQLGDLVDEFCARRGDRKRHPSRVGDTLAAPKNASGLPKSLRPWARRFHSAHDCPGFSGGSRRRLHRSRGTVGGLRPGGHEHDVLRRDGDRCCRAIPLVVEPVDGDAARRRARSRCP